MATQGTAVHRAQEVLQPRLQERTAGGGASTLIRSLGEKRAELQLSFVLAKLDIQKACDSVLWSAIQWVSGLRGLPTWLHAAYWCIHVDHVLSFRTCDDTISFALRPHCGMPQGAPESPARYACIAEGLIALAEGIFAVTGRPAAVPVPEAVVEHDAAAVEYPKHESAFRPSNVVYANFADDTYVWGQPPLRSPPQQLMWPESSDAQGRD